MIIVINSLLNKSYQFVINHQIVKKNAIDFQNHHQKFLNLSNGLF